MDVDSIITLIFLYSFGLMGGWGIIFILLWIRPEYGFLIFYVVANHILIFLIFDVWRLTWEATPRYVLSMTIAAGIAIAVGVPLVALFKWLKTRKSSAEHAADREIERIRAEIAARESGSQ